MLNLNSILTRAKDLKIAVIGDLIEDIYIYGSVNRISPEAPVPVVEYHETKRTMGGAGNVYVNISNLCEGVELYCFHDGDHFWTDDHEYGMYRDYHQHSKKTRIMSGQYHMLRVDDEPRGVERDIIQKLKLKEIDWWPLLERSLNTEHFNAIVLSDYNKGVLSNILIEVVISYASKYKIPVIVDAKKYLERFEGATIVKCNEHEWKSSEHVNPDVFCAYFRVDNLVKTCGSRGIEYYDSSTARSSGGGKSIPGIECPIVDVCGAGDTVTAILAIMKALGENIHDACELANIAAAEVCKYSGVTPIDEEKLIKAYDNYKAR